MLHSIHSRCRFLFIAAVLPLIAMNAKAQNRDYHSLHKIPVEIREAPSETHAALIRGASPYMPPRAKRSGYCCMVMDIPQNGRPQNIKTSYCSNEIFKKPSLKATKYWRFDPAVIDGVPIAIKGQTQMMSFRVTNQQGQIIPDKRGTIVVNGKLDFSFERLCKVPEIS